jgi:hypothetical protein
MRASETVHAEPRDLIESPIYRVNFWQKPAPGHAWNLDAYALTDAKDFSEVLQWVNDHAVGRRFEVFVEIDQEHVQSFGTPRTTGLIRILGTDPNVGETTEIGSFIKM